MIEHFGAIQVPESVTQYADSIKLQNYKTNMVKQFQRHFDRTVDLFTVMMRLAQVADEADHNKLEPVFFSVCQGAKSHVDELGTEFLDYTYVIPLVVPVGRAELTVGDSTKSVQLNHVYRFKHSTEHSLHLENTEDGCTVLMVAVKT